jgi:drug/metabolite transporter (DMT)-like permease
MCGGLLFGLQAMALRKLKSASPGQALILGNFLTFLVGLPAWGTSWPSPTGWLFVLALGVVQMGAACYFYAQAVPRVSSLELVLVPILEPVICPFWVTIFFLHELPGFWNIGGSLAVIFSAALWSCLKARSQSGAEAR